MNASLFSDGYFPTVVRTLPVTVPPPSLPMLPPKDVFGVTFKRASEPCPLIFGYVVGRGGGG